METRPNIEEQIDAALRSAKSIQPVELSPDFSDRVMNKVHSRGKVRMLYTVSPLLKVAAMFIIILINAFTLRLFLRSEPAQNPAQYATISDFVNEYQINDTGEDVLTLNIPKHE